MNLRSPNASRRGFSVTLLAQLGVLALGAFTGTAAARLLGPHGRGELAGIILWPSMLATVAALGINQAIVFHTGQRRFTVSEIWTASTLIGIAQAIFLVAVGLAIVPWALRAYSPEVRRLAQVFVCASPLVVLSGYPGNLLQGKLQLVSFNLIRLVAPAVYALGLAALLLFHRPALGWVLAVQIAGLVAMLICGYALLLRSSWHGHPAHEGDTARMAVPRRAGDTARMAVPRLRFQINRAAVAALAGFGAKTELGSISTYINQRVDQLVLSLFVAPEQLGLYVVAVTVATSIQFLPQASAIVTLASGANLAPAQARAVIGRAFRRSLAWLVAASAALFVVTPWLVPFVFGARFAESTLACRILLPGTIALGLNQVLFDGARALNQPGLPSWSEGLAAVLTCVGLALLLPRWGYLGAAVASTAAYMTSLILTLGLYRRRLRIGLNQLLGLAATLPLASRVEMANRTA